MATERIRVTAEKFLIEKDNGFAVLRARVFNGETLRAVGNLRGIQLGMEYEFVGRYSFHPSFGQQFEVDAFSVQVSTSKIGIERFLSSGRFKGVGVKTAKAIVEHFGVHTIEILTHEPERVQEVPALPASRAKILIQSFAAHQEVARLASFLRGHELPIHLADKLTKRYGSGAAAMEILQTHPYQMVEDVRGIGFRTADLIAQAVGVPAHSPERMAAALIHVLAVAREEGHLFLPMAEWTQRASELLQIPAEDVAAISGRLIARRAVVVEKHQEDDLAVYGLTMYRVETSIADRVHALMASATTQDMTFIEGDSSSLSPMQAAAARAVWDAPLVIITGGPGTGKTTTVREVVRTAEATNKRVILAAPTGRAAQRLMESTGQSAQTLHRLLEMGQSDAGPFRFTRGQERPLDGDVFIVDEASMIDAPLFSSFLDALPEGAHLVLVGDPEQLPSVGPGQILRDLIDSGIARVFALDQIFRQEEKSAIITASHRVRSGLIPDLKRELSGDFFFIEENDPVKASELVVELAAERIPRYLHTDSRLSVQVLAPMRKGLCGIDHLNQLLSARLTQQVGPFLNHGGRSFYVQDKVMNVKNDYERDIYNGDMGIVVGLTDDHLDVRFGTGDDTRVVGLERGDLLQIVHAYAVSVHKSQGSEYPCVVMPIMREHAVMLFRQLIYTGMTRAKQLLVLVGQRSALELAVRKAESMHRYTYLAERLKGGEYRL